MDDRTHLIGQMKNRALIYMEVYDVLAKELGAQKAEALLAQAIYNRGRKMGKAFAKFSPSDLAGLRDAFLASVPGGEAIFQPQVLKSDAESLRDPAARLPAQGCVERTPGLRKRRSRRCAGSRVPVDKGLFEGAGFAFENRTWAPGAEGCCFLSIHKG
jgi:hypothetical protein